MIPLSQGFYCEQPQILLAGKKYIFGPQGLLLAQSLELTRLPKLTSEDCAAPCWRHPGLLAPVLPWWEVQEVGRGNVPLLHWVGSKRRPSGSHRAFLDHLWAMVTGPYHFLCPSVPRTLPTIPEILTPHPIDYP